MKYLLDTMFDSRKSFYGKAIVKTSDTNNYTSYLYSYDTLVAMADTEDREVELYENWDSSQTTIRHVKEFLKQQGFKADSKQQIMEDYL